MTTRRPVLGLALAALALLSLTACASGTSASGSTTTSATSAAESTTAGSSAVSSATGSTAPSSSDVSTTASGTTSSAAVATCAPSEVKTMTAGKLTIATDDPAYEPWMVDNDPTNGKGYESAVAYAVATKLGFSKDQVSWIRVKFNTAISPAPKNFDFDINQFSISADREKAVDFSTGYYDVTQAVVATASSPIAKATTVDALKSAKLGAQIGTTSLTALKAIGGQTPTVFQTNDAAVQGLKNGQVDGLVVDLPTAFYMAAAQLDNGVIVGQLPETGGQQEQFGLLLEKGSALTSCASKAVDALRADGTLAALTKQWLTGQGAPVLK